ncbi:uncharacterized protein RSE6_15101 [Rhynchosporium secalis]|uniref:Uncharacterized protein n=1 Tax=Rhynchosporium secalis TaxID=38038 RepID=A0A1E1MWP7_RHYSE|nr:uncharacterized protein RSE6_15101 [Rhynchosporium secalis]
MKNITELCQANIAKAAQKQEDNANKTRTPAPIYRKGDKRSLDTKHAKYTVEEVLSPLSVRLSGIPENIHPVFYTDLLRPASNDPLIGQETDDKQPDLVLFETHEEFSVE